MLQAVQVERMPALSHTAASGLRELRMINSINGLRTNILNIEAFRNCVQLQKLLLHGFTVDLSPLAGCALQEISLPFSHISDLSPLGACAQLKNISLVGTKVSNLRGAGQLLELNIGQLHKLDISHCRGLLSLDGIQACSQLQHLDMSFCECPSSLAPLSACALLKKVNLRGTTVTSVGPLQACAHLEELSIGRRDPPGLAALEAALPRLRIDKVN
jgi:Leucine-rich repeat (LRR) protein